jgi:choline dehydrogenase-like flavoprotein
LQCDIGYDVENLYVTDGSFMLAGGSVPHTWTIYANAFRVAETLLVELGGETVPASTL